MPDNVIETLITPARFRSWRLLYCAWCSA